MSTQEILATLHNIQDRLSKIEKRIDKLEENDSSPDIDLSFYTKRIEALEKEKSVNDLAIKDLIKFCINLRSEIDQVSDILFSDDINDIIRGNYCYEEPLVVKDDQQLLQYANYGDEDGYHCPGITKFLIEKFKLFDENVFYEASSRGDLEIVKHFTENNKTKCDFQSALKVAFDSRYDEDCRLNVIKYLVGNCGAFPEHYMIDQCKDRKIQKYFEQFDLFGAIKKGDLSVVKKLINKEIAKKKNSEGKTPLQCALEKGNLSIIQCIVEDGHADLNEKDKNGLDPLTYASKNGKLEIAKYLITKMI